jgi:hypothetical protein
VAFVSIADDLVSGDTNGAYDVFVRDRESWTTTRVSVNSDGTQADSNSRWDHALSITDDGRYVSFVSQATNLVPDDMNAAWDVFVHDCWNVITERASVAIDGTEGDDHSPDGCLSADGRYVALASDASNLVSDDRNGVRDVLVRRRW